MGRHRGGGKWKLGVKRASCKKEKVQLKQKRWVVCRTVLRLTTILTVCNVQDNETGGVREREPCAKTFEKQDPFLLKNTLIRFVQYAQVDDVGPSNLSSFCWTELLLSHGTLSCPGTVFDKPLPRTRLWLSQSDPKSVIKHLAESRSESPTQHPCAACHCW